MKRIASSKILVPFFILVLVIGSPIAGIVLAQNTYPKIWGYRDDGISDRFSGATSYIGNYPPSFGSVPTGEFAGAYTAVSNITNYPFVEAGSGRHKGPNTSDGQLRPFASFANVNGAGITVYTNSVILGEGSWYSFAAYHVGGDNWRAHYCDGNGCYYLTANPIDIDRSAMRYIITGNESSLTSVQNGTFYSWENQFLFAGTQNWNLWCYTGELRNEGGIISSCGYHFGYYDWSGSR